MIHGHSLDMFPTEFSGFPEKPTTIYAFRTRATWENDLPPNFLPITQGAAEVASSTEKRNRAVAN